MNTNFFISTNHQKVLSFLTKFSDEEFYEREIARKINISTGSAHAVLNELFLGGLLKRRIRGKMYFYSIDDSHPAFEQFKILNNIVLVLPLVEMLKNISFKIVLYGSCAKGRDTSKSDIDIFIVSDQQDKVLQIIRKHQLGNGFEGIEIQPVILSPLELLQSEKKDREFLSLVNEGIVLWETPADESRV